MLNVFVLIAITAVAIGGVYRLYRWIDSSSRVERVLHTLYDARLNEKDIFKDSSTQMKSYNDSLISQISLLLDDAGEANYVFLGQKDVKAIKLLFNEFSFNFKTTYSLFNQKRDKLNEVDSLFNKLHSQLFVGGNAQNRRALNWNSKLNTLSSTINLKDEFAVLLKLQSELINGSSITVSKDSLAIATTKIYDSLYRSESTSNSVVINSHIADVRATFRLLEASLFQLHSLSAEGFEAQSRLKVSASGLRIALENTKSFQNMAFKEWGFYSVLVLGVVVLFIVLGGLFLLLLFLRFLKEDADYKASAEKSLFEKQKFLDDIITNTTSMVSVKDLSGRYTLVNTNWQEVFGLPYGDVIGKTEMEVFPNRRINLFSEFEQKALNHGISQQVEETFTLSGRDTVYLSNVFPISDNNGNVVSVCTISISLAPLRETQMALERSKRDYKTIVANVPGIVFHCKDDEPRTMIVISDGVKVLTGVSPNDFLNNVVHFADLIASEDLQSVRDEIARAVKRRRPYEIEYRVKDVRGKVHWVYERGGSHLLPETNEVTLQGVIMDITEQKLSSDSVNSRDKFLAGVADAVKELIVNPAVDEAIKRAMRIIGESANVDNSFVFRNFVDEDDVFRTSQLFVWHKGKIAPAFRNDLQHLDFESFVPRWYHILSERRDIMGCMDDFPADEHPVLAQLESGSIIIISIFTRELFWGFIGFGVPEKNKVWTEAEKAIFKAFSVTLGIAIAKAEDASALVEAKETAEAATRTKSDFLARMSHEIRTPMNAIIGWTHLAMEKEINAIQSDYLRKIQSSSKALLGIINDILDFSKIEADKLTIEYIDFDLEDVMNDLSSMVSYKGQEKNLEMVFSVAPDVPLSLVGDPLRLVQVLVNLVNNAVKFTAKGEIVVNVKVEDDVEGEIILRFDVTDTGIGLTEAQLVNLFDSFSQADITTTRKYGGTGLGLAICKRLTVLMGGDIWVESQYGVGSTFSFTANFGLQRSQKKNRSVLAHEINGLSVLICDKNASSARALAQMLMAFKCKPIITYTAKGALHELGPTKLIKPDLIFIDWRVDHIEEVILLQNSGSMSIIDIPVIAMLSNYNQDESVKNVKALGLAGILYKPFNYSSVLDVIMDALGKTLIKRVVRRPDAGFYLKALKKKKGLRVLLVEDNETNQQIGLELIMLAGIKVDIAENGQEAIKMIVDSGFPSKYCLVFMDIQMPIMDGYKATTEIRKLGIYENLPIIAMTADAIGGALERYLSVGMDGMVAKPIDPEEMYKAILEWSDKNTDHSQIHKLGISESTIDVKLDPSLQASANLPQIEGINVQECLNRLVGRIDFFNRLITRFYYDHLDFEERFLSAVQANDEELATRMLHSFKGMMGTIAATEIYPLSKEVEIAYIEKEPSFDMKFKHMVGLLNRLLTELANNKFIVLDPTLSKKTKTDEK